MAAILATCFNTNTAMSYEQNHNRISLNEMKKGQNELLEIANPLVQTRVSNNAGQHHASENRGTCVYHVQHVILASARELADRASLQQIRHKKQHPHQFLIIWLVPWLEMTITVDNERGPAINAVLPCSNL
jgi:hypothetical protein